MWSPLLYLSVLWISALAQEMIIKPPKIIEPAKNYKLYIKKNNRKVLQCQATGIPPPTYVWRISKDYKTWTSVKPMMGFVTLDSRAGNLTIHKFDKSYEGMYQCVARHTYQTRAGWQEAASISPIINLNLLQLDDFSDTTTPLHHRGNEFDYQKMPCSGQGENPGIFTYTWYKGEQQINFGDERFFIDSEGNLHIAYLKREDNTAPENKYKCGYSSDILSIIKLGRPNELEVTSVSQASKTKPSLVYSNNGKEVMKGHKAVLECMFKGYDPTPPHLPQITWFKGDDNDITDNDRFTITNQGRRLTIKNVLEKDSGTFHCVTEGADKQPVKLIVLSPPIFDTITDAPHNVIRPENTDVTFNCRARSARDDDTEPDPPTWLINGYGATDKNKYNFTKDNKSLTIKRLSKATDNICVQCMVNNHHGLTLKEGCITVLLPITITYPVQRNPRIVVKYGDVADMTVTATTDKSVELRYQWMFKNETHPTDWIPEWMSYNPNTFAATINTSMLTEEEYLKIGGTYTRRIWHDNDEAFVYITLELNDPEIAPVVVAAKFDMWILGLIIGIIFLIIVVVIIIFIICRKQQEGDYNVDKKEHGAGLDPEEELKNKGFDDYSRPDYGDYDYPDRKPRGELEYDDVPIGGDDESLGEYGDEATYFNEDGSFIGIYQKKEQPTKNQHATESTI